MSKQAGRRGASNAASTLTTKKGKGFVMAEGDQNTTLGRKVRQDTHASNIFEVLPL